MTSPITEIEAFHCDKCPASFLHRYSLTRHRVTHSDIRFECSICKTLFKYKTNLKRHEKNTHDVKRQCKPRSMYNVMSNASGPLRARDWIDLTKNSDDEDDLSDLQCDQTAPLKKVKQGVPSSMKSGRIGKNKTVSYTCNSNEPGNNSNVCLCGFCTTIEIKDEIENDPDMPIECPPSQTSCEVGGHSSVDEEMTIECASSKVISDRKYKKCNISNRKPLKLSDLDSYRFPEERYKMAKEYIIEQHKKINSYEKTIRDLENCIGIMNEELIRYKNKYKNVEIKN